jgi:hypothetical protein
MGLISKSLGQSRLVNRVHRGAGERRTARWNLENRNQRFLATVPYVTDTETTKILFPLRESKTILAS